MAAKEKEKKKSGAVGGGTPGGKPAPSEKKQKKSAASAAPRAAHTGVGLPVSPPRLRDFYNATVRPKLMKEFVLANLHEIPGLSKIVLNVGYGEAIKQPKVLDKIVEELGLITRTP
jgi:hypothetical protein